MPRRPKHYLVLDTETLGLNLLLHQIAEIGAVILDGETLEEMGCYRSYLQPRTPVYFEADALKVNGLTIEQLYREGRPGYEVWTTVNSWLQGHSSNQFTIETICTNKSFDMPRIDREYTLYGLKGLHVHPANKWDVRDMAWSYDLDLERYKLETLCKHFDVPYVNAHNALSDARLTAEVFRRIMKMRAIASQAVKDQLPLPTLPVDVLI